MGRGSCWLIFCGNGSSSLSPTFAFFLQIILGIESSGDAGEGGTMRFRVLQNENLPAENADEHFIAGLNLERFAGLSRNDDLILRGYGGFSHALH